MESRDIVLVGVWAFTIISLLGGMAGQFDGFWIIIFFIVAVGISLGIIAMPKESAKQSSSA